jgi:phytoene synthase
LSSPFAITLRARVEIKFMESWEPALIRLAREALRPPALLPAPPPATQVELAAAYAYCERETARHSRSFSLASSLMPEPKRSAIRALYTFCRMADDAVDRPNRTEAYTWEWWMAQAMRPSATPGHRLAALAWWDTCVRFDIPARAVDQVLAGVRCDFDRAVYPTFDELAHYCYGVASTVGLLSMHIIGYSGPEAIPFAVRLGVALQVTNILRDVGEDLNAGRLYLPQEDLDFFGVRRDDLTRGTITPAWRSLMRFQINRARELYAAAAPGIGLLHADGQWAVAAAAEFYRGILSDLEAHDYNAFTYRARVSGWGKLRRLPGLWWRVTTGHYSPQVGRVVEPVTG